MKKPKAPRILTVAIFTTITIIFWVFFSVYRVLTTKPLVKVPPELLEPITPNLDTGALGKLEKRVFFEEGETVVPAPISPTPSPSEKTAPEEVTESTETTPEATESPSTTTQ